MSLVDLLKHNPEIVFVGEFLDQYLSTNSFREFFEIIYNFPNVYQGLNNKKEYWEHYLKDNYPDHYEFISTKDEINWFYETIIANFSNYKYYYYNKDSLLFYDVKSNKKFIRKEKQSYPQYLDQDSILDIYLNMFSFNNEIPYKNIKQIYQSNSINIIILFSTGLLIHKFYRTEKTIMNGVKKIIYMQTGIDPNLIILKQTGEIFKYNIFAVELDKINLPFNVDDINQDGGFPPSGNNPRYYMLSLIDTEGNLYSIDSSLGPDNDYYINGFAVNNPFDISLPIRDHDENNQLITVQRRFPIVSYVENEIYNHGYSIINQGDARHVDNPQNFNILLSTKLYYIISLGDKQRNVLCRTYYSDYQKVNDTITIDSYDNVNVMKVWSKKVTLNIDGNIRYQDIFFYSDDNDNIYELDGNLGGHIKYIFPEEVEDKRVKQFIIEIADNKNILIFVTNTKIYFHIYQKIDTQVNQILTIDTRYVKDIPYGTRIVNSEKNNISLDGYIGPILKVPELSDHVFIPYPLYLEYLVNDLVEKDYIKDNNIIFTIKNSNYLFQTTIPTVK